MFPILSNHKPRTSYKLLDGGKGYGLERANNDIQARSQTLRLRRMESFGNSNRNAGGVSVTATGA
jgi:hypothetical protein